MKKNCNKTAYNSMNLIEKYDRAIYEVGLWKSEKYVINKYFPIESRVLDVACGAGRTTYGIYYLGYRNVTGIDFSSKMIDIAKKHDISSIKFVCCDMCDMPFESNSFDSILVSYNALMMVPKYNNRILALCEFYRVLSENGILVFTASDREYNPKYKQFWEEEKERWNNGVNDDRLYDYGDQMFTECGEDVFIHFSSKQEIDCMLQETGFRLLECFFRDKFVEPRNVKEFSGDTMFYVAQKMN